MKPNTIVFDLNGKSIADADDMLKFSLSKGMRVIISGYSAQFEVIDWEFCNSKLSEKSEIRIRLEKTPTLGWKKTKFLNV